jgi:hypothetical protein
MATCAYLAGLQKFFRQLRPQNVKAIGDSDRRKFLWLLLKRQDATSIRSHSTKEKTPPFENFVCSEFLCGGDGPTKRLFAGIFSAIQKTADLRLSKRSKGSRHWKAVFIWIQVWEPALLRIQLLEKLRIMAIRRYTYYLSNSRAAQSQSPKY